MPQISRVVVAAALVATTLPTRAYACSGPCTSPELWGLVPLDDSPLVITNFGLLSQTGDGWQLTCEEVIGGLLLAVESNNTQAVVSTDVGLFSANRDRCGFTPGPTSERSNWFLDFVVADDSTVDSPHMLGLVSDSTASVINLEVSKGGVFEILHDLGSETAYRHVEATPDLRSIVVAGYASQPRRWRLAWSADSGESWQEFTPELDAPTASALLMGLDRDNPDRVFFQLQATDDTPAELWSFERTTQTATQLWVLDPGFAITGLEFVGDEVWLSSKSQSAGGLYRADLPDVATFEPVMDAVPPLACLGVVDDQPFVCVDDYSNDSPFLLGEVNAEGRTFEPLLRLADFGKLQDCGSACSETRAWLESAYGGGSDTGSDTSGEPDTTDVQEPMPPTQDDGGCVILPVERRSAADFALLGLGLLVGALFVGRRRVVT